MLLVRLMKSSASRTNHQPGDRVVCFGEHSSWSFTIQESFSPSSGSSNLSQSENRCSIQTTELYGENGPSTKPQIHSTHYCIPDTIDVRTHDLPDTSADSIDDEYALLCKKGAFTLPLGQVQDALLAAFFRWVHPALYILNRREFMELLAANRVSPLLLQAIFFVSSIYVEMDAIQAHYPCRHAMEVMFFKRAKALYDAEYEKDTITIIQSLFFMSFWWASLMESNGFSHWLGAAITLAQARGMHRS